MIPQHPARPRPRRLLPHLLGTAAVAAAITAGLGGPGLAQGAGAAAARAAEATLRADTPRVQLRSVPANSYADSLREPAVVRSVNGVLDATVRVDTATLPVPRTADSSAILNLRTYQLTATTSPGYRPNDPRYVPAFPGPTFRVQRGDQVRIRLLNELPQAGPDSANDVCIQATPAAGGQIPDVFQACFHGPSYTNIHYHGTHVTPDSIRVTTGDSATTFVGDDVLLAIAPGSSIQYNFRIPSNQSPGTHWYHPHKHGSVAMQVANGMAGAFIVEDTTMGLDSIVRSLRMVEHLIAIQQVAQTVGLLDQPGVLDHPAPLVNGQLRPTIYMAPGEVQRWRIVNENTTRTTKTFDVGFRDVPRAEEPSLFDIARDGVQFAPANYDATQPDLFLHMAPGQRLDVFVRAPQAVGTHEFTTTHIPGAGRQSRNASLPADRTLLGAPAPDTVVLFRVVVDPSLRGRNTTLPTSLPPLPPFLAGERPAQRDTALIVFTDSLNQQPSQFYLGSRLNPFQRYDDNSVFVPSDTTGRALPMELGGTQTWKIVNNSQQQINHPFHIHINPFQVNRVVYPLGEGDPFHALYKQLNDAAARGEPIWLDVLPLPQPATSTGSTQTGLPQTDTIFMGNDTIVVPDSLQNNVTASQPFANGTPNTAYVVITQRYDDFQGCPNGSCGPPTGYFVMHCHILGHEERGMMQVLQVVEPGQSVSPPAGHVGHGPAPRRPAPGTQRGSGQGGGGQRRQNQQPGHQH